jgi:hypothetical protein
MCVCIHELSFIDQVRKGEGQKKRAKEISLRTTVDIVSLGFKFNIY